MSDAAADTPLAQEAAASPATVIPSSRIMIALLRREFWEHRALWIVPLVTGALMVGLAALSHAGPGGYDQFPFGPFNWRSEGRPISDPRALAVAFFALRQWITTVPLFLATTVMLYFYLLSSLYDERKDRSILFWKSLPVSDAQTVLSKLLVALVVVPLGVCVVAVVTQLLCTAVWGIRESMGLAPGLQFVWDTVAYLKSDALMLMVVVLSSLWYAPVVGYLMLVSAWARRNPFLWAVLPPLILAVAEGISFGTWHLRNIFLARLAGAWTSLGLNGAASDAFNGAMLRAPFGRLISLPAVWDLIDLRRVFITNIDLWAGVAVAAAFVYVAIRLRRFRDDT
jgi:ABC-2 type transport system permease protein